MSSFPYLSIIVPAFNEAERLQQTLPRFQDYLNSRKFAWELILVDDGSSDGTHESLNEGFPEDRVRVFRNPINMGKGYSVRCGVARASGDRILVTDADLSSPLDECDKLMQFLDDGHDIAIGSRALQDSNVVRHQAWYREGMGKAFNLLVQSMVLPGFWDTQCGFKCFKRDSAASIFDVMTVNRFCFDVEFLFIARKRGLKIKEVPVHWENVSESRVRLVADSSKMFWDLFRIRYNDLRGLYG